MHNDNQHKRLTLLEKLKITAVCSLGAAIWGVIFVGAMRGLAQSF